MANLTQAEIDELREPFFKLFGELAVLYSNLEFGVEETMLSLADKNNPWLRILSTELSFAKKIQRSKELAKVRLLHDSVGREKVIEVLKEVDQLRIQRNSFIHGQWIVNNELLADNKVMCTDWRWRTMPKDTSAGWSSASDKIWTFDEIRDLKERVSQMCLKVGRLCNKISSANLLPCQIIREKNTDK